MHESPRDALKLEGEAGHTFLELASLISVRLAGGEAGHYS
jgi:hypothetical protein